MNFSSSFKYFLDLIGIGLLASFLYLSLAFRASPISFMNPGFPILADSDWTPAPPLSLSWQEYPQRIVDKDEFSEVTYYSRLHLYDNSQMFPNPYVSSRIEPTAFTGFQTVIRYAKNDQALFALQSDYAEYIGKLKPYQILITEIPGLKFSSKADKYYLWCEQITPDHKTTFDPVAVDTCYCWSVYGRYYSQIRFFLWPDRGNGRQFSMALFNDVLNRADHKLANAQEHSFWEQK